MGHRYYDPTLGRFTQPDPSGQEKKNPYLYANGDPINNTDLNGLLSLGGIFDAAGWAGMVGAALTGDTGEVRAQAAGLITSAGVFGLCEGGAALISAPAGGSLAVPACHSVEPSLRLQERVSRTATSSTHSNSAVRCPLAVA